jgi:hypothetical protein
VSIGAMKFASAERIAVRLCKLGSDPFHISLKERDASVPRYLSIINFFTVKTKAKK